MEKRSTTRPLVLSILTTTTLLSLACMFTRISTRRSLNPQATPTPFYTTRPYPPPSSFKVAPTPVDPGPSHSEKYLAYLPHSGFHNQRVALENALFLAKVSNRTLLLPPVRLGIPLSYVPFDELYAASANSTKAGLEYCSEATSGPPECANYTSYTHVSWDRLVDLSNVRREQHLLEGWNFTDAWLQEHLGVHTEDTFYLKDSDRNHYSFQDFLKPDTGPLRKFNESIHISALARRPERLIQLGTLFGSSRLHLRSAAHFTARGRIREQMVFTNTDVVRAAASIRSALGPAYLAAHLRIGDGVFEWNASDNVRGAWWRLLRGPLGFSDDKISELEAELFPDEDILPPPALPAPDLPALRSPLPPRPTFSWHVSPPPGLSCRGPLHSDSELVALNTPLYIATDARAPSLDALLWRFVRTFPCSFFLEDFEEHTRPLLELRNEADGVALGGFLMPFLDAMVAGHGWEVVGTEQSTFSAFVCDVLWRRYHGYDIVQRG